VSSVVAELVRARGFEVVTTQGAGLLRNSDAGHLAHAVRDIEDTVLDSLPDAAIRKR
jgi:hypothetical protein